MDSCHPLHSGNLAKIVHSTLTRAIPHSVVSLLATYAAHQIFKLILLARKAACTESKKLAYLRTGLFFLSVLSHHAYAASIQAASCSQSDVQSAITLAAAGDTISIPAGSCSWSTPVAIAGKPVSVQGAGVGLTNIDDKTGSAFNAGALQITGASSTNFANISNMTFSYTTPQARSVPIVSVSGVPPGGGAQAGFRIHDIGIRISACVSRGIQTQAIYGLIDHVVITVTSGSGCSVQGLTIYGSIDATDGGWTPWTQPLSFGTANAVYVEDSSFTSSIPANPEDIIDASSGARLVIRHNTFSNTHIGFHGTDSGGHRGLFSVEVYANTFTNSTSDVFNSGSLRGGTAVWYNNTYLGPGSWNNVLLRNYRGCMLASAENWGACNGTQWQLPTTNTSLTQRAYGTASIMVDWVPAKDYLQGALIMPSSGNAAHRFYQAQGACTSGSVAPAWPQSWSGTTVTATDGSCNWVLLGGNGQYAGTAKWCSSALDTACTSDANCSGGGTCSAYLDGTGTAGYPCRDQVGRTQNQVLAPVYSWGNVGGGNLAADNGSSSVCGGGGISNYISVNREYYNATPMPGYAPYAYPHPLQNVIALPPAPPTNLSVVVR